MLLSLASNSEPAFGLVAHTAEPQGANISEYGIRQKETEAVIEEVKARYRDAFTAITVLWKGRLY
jgi:hypothetical protein